MSSREIRVVSEWELDHEFTNKDGEKITCGERACALGSYVLSTEGSGTLYGPACTTCEFNGGLGDVFNDAEPRFEPGAPENFKRGAAKVLTDGVHTPIDAIRTGRPNTAVMIDAYAAQ